MSAALQPPQVPIYPGPRVERALGDARDHVERVAVLDLHARDAQRMRLSPNRPVLRRECPLVTRRRDSLLAPPAEIGEGAEGISKHLDRPARDVLENAP